MLDKMDQKAREGQTPKRRKFRCWEEFCQHYVRIGNGAEALKLAGHLGNEATRRSVASRALTRASVIDRINELKAESARAHGITRDDLLRELLNIVNFDPTPMVRVRANGTLAYRDKRRWPKGALKYVQVSSSRSRSTGDQSSSDSNSVSIKATSDRVKAIEVIARMTGNLTNDRKAGDKRDWESFEHNVLSAIRRSQK